jgi:hypothetical protein
MEAVEVAVEAIGTTIEIQEIKRSAQTVERKVFTSPRIVWSCRQMRASANQDGNQYLRAYEESTLQMTGAGVTNWGR